MEDWHARRTSSILFTANAKIYKPGSDFGYGNMSGYRYLDLSFFFDIDLNAIKSNPLITIKENKIYFKYEEN